MSGKLYIVPTPIGNLEDMTPRAISVLKNCNLILAEDTRTSNVLMKHFGINTPMISHHKFNEHSSIENVTKKLIAGESIALISDAGTPAISDPGFLLSRECRRLNIQVETLPGSTAFVPALVNSGLPCERFCFEGKQIIWDESKQKILTGIEQILKPQYTAVLWISEWLKDNRKIILTEQTVTQLTFRIKSV